ncbi:MAG: tetratricopeptide repeat protein [Flavobacteriales bacterium]|nr:tetratricopeptide repeat protein [Flavobacteriales bacterium]
MGLIRIISRYGWLLVGGLLLSCAGQKATTASQNDPDASEMTDRTRPAEGGKRAQIMRVFMDATNARLSGQLPKAAQLFEKCLALDPDNDAAMFELAKIQHTQQRPEQALALAKKARNTDPDNIWYHFLLADLHGQYGQGKEAISVYRDILTRWPERHEVRFQLAHALAMNGQVADARKEFEAIRNTLGESEEVTMQEYGMLVNGGELEEALELLERARRNDPQNMTYAGMLADLYDELGRPQDALALYMEVLELDPDDSMVRLALAEHFYGEGKSDLAFEQLGIAFADPDLDVDTKMQVLLSFFEMTSASGVGDSAQDSLLNEAYRLIDVLETTHPESGKPHTIKGDFLMRDGRSREARDAFREALVYEKDRYPIWMQLLQLDLQLGDDQALANDAEEASELFPTDPTIYLFLGIGASRIGEHDKAIEALVTGRDLVIDDPRLSAQFWSSLGDAYNESNDHPRSDEAFDKALELDPDNATTLNNYAYYLSLRGEQLDKASRMSLRSNELAPGQPSFQDTYAWVLYRNGKFQEALIWIEKALASGGGAEGVIVEHHGDILFALGDKEGALLQWKKAQEMGGASEEIDKKVAEGRPPQ